MSSASAAAAAAAAPAPPAAPKVREIHHREYEAEATRLKTVMVASAILGTALVLFSMTGLGGASVALGTRIAAGVVGGGGVLALVTHIWAWREEKNAQNTYKKEQKLARPDSSS